MEKAGKAYAFFDCSASKKAIESELPAVRIDTQIPNELELLLVEGVENLRGDSALMPIAREAEEEGMKYVMEATYPGVTNKKTSGELQALLINLSNSLFYHTPEHIQGKVVYEMNGRYVFRD